MEQRQAATDSHHVHSVPGRRAAVWGERKTGPYSARATAREDNTVTNEGKELVRVRRCQAVRASLEFEREFGLGWRWSSTCRGYLRVVYPNDLIPGVQEDVMPRIDFLCSAKECSRALAFDN